MFFLRMLLVAALALPVLADPGDTTVVVTFAQELHNFAAGGRDNVASFQFPEQNLECSQIWMEYRLDCPSSPGDCDPWDRTARLYVQRDLTDSTHEDIEIARVITPYDITGSGRPGHCEWDFDMLEYQSLLRGEVTLHSFVDTWIGGSQGWLVTCTFYFVEGEMPITPYRVEQLWSYGGLVYGDPDNPIDNYLDFSFVPVDALGEFATVRIWTTGHGQGNTHNAAEFSQKTHGVWIGLDTYEHLLWRNDCASNPCSPQGGTWEFSRAGWCPGDRVYPWDIPFVEVTPGSTIDIWPTIEPYENFCRPTNPDCVSGVTCTDCNYNDTGHTQPVYITSGQVIFWTLQDVAADRPEVPVPASAVLHQNFPNPFNPSTTISFLLDAPGHVVLRVFDVQGREVSSLLDHDLTRGLHQVQFNGSGLASGVYFARLETHNEVFSNKMLMLK
ncbi:MAG: T9SS type A sorting domain-containing protein [Calditrichaeota bacterium]|nr:T9SS type A sorting domain-containing protein [Calditrichota bacterium]MCB9367046.1 T9SS type A sorting domain-containing protein [Calditrichota bacterium]MCB9391470.1 T9SS type A sorting domain-containing protein [Calditrichota bacterium]